MAIEPKPRTAETNARLWGARAQDWANIQEGTCEPVYRAVFDRVGLGSGTTYLDAGCGAGMAAQIAAERGAEVVGLDAAPDLLAVARSRVPNGVFHQGDLEELPFPDRHFDLVTGFNSFQYAGHPPAALAEAQRVAKKGAHVVVVTWGEPDGMEAATVIGAIKHLLPPPPPGAPGPFALSSEAALVTFAASTGLEPLEVFDVDAPFEYPDLPTAVRGLCSAGVAVRAMETAGDAAVKEAYARAVAPFQRGDGSCRVGASFRCLLARA